MTDKMSNQNTLQKAAFILETWKQGKIIQFLSKGFGGAEWIDLKSSVLDIANLLLTMTSNIEVRIKPETKLVPFTFEDAHLLRNKWIRDSVDKTEFLVLSINDDKVWFLDLGVYRYLYFSSLIDTCYTFADTGEPCGKIVEK